MAHFRGPLTDTSRKPEEVSVSTVIKALCTDCNSQLDLEPEEVLLHTYDRGNRDYYEFHCHECHVQVVRWASTEAIAALRSGRVPENRIFLPTEALDPVRLSGRLEHDDVLDFMNGLKALQLLPDELLH